MQLQNFHDMNSDWNDIAGNEHIKIFLQNIIERNTISHAYLFEGVEGIGKKLTAKVFAKKLTSGQNINIIEPIGKMITLDQVKSAKKQLSLKASNGRTTVLIIDEMDKLNMESGNFLLKLIEEPPAGNVIIGVTSKYQNVLPTITSRMQRITFNPLKYADATVILNRLGADPETTEFLWGLFPGSAGRPCFWLANRQMFTVYENTVDVFIRAGVENAFNPADEAEKLYNAAMNMVKSMGSRYKSQAEALLDFAGRKYSDGIKQLEELEKKEAARNTDMILYGIYDIIASLCRDAVMCKEQTDKIVNKTFADKINLYSRDIDVKHVVELLETIKTAYNDLQYNIDRKLALETLLFRIREVNRYARCY